VGKLPFAGLLLKMRSELGRYQGTLLFRQVAADILGHHKFKR
jgi:hypothetical protein